MATSEDERLGLLGLVAAGIAGLVLGWLHEAVMFFTLMLALVAMTEALSAGGVVWAAVGVVAPVGTVFAVFGPLVRHWRPLSTWLTMLTATAVNLGVILVQASSPLSGRVDGAWVFLPLVTIC